MNRYPLWKYILIAAAVVVGLIYTLPNFYGEVPAVQVSPLRANLKADAALMGRIEDTFKKAGLVPEGVALDANSVKARFATTDNQLKAKDALQGALGDDYVVALNLLSRSPQWLTSIGALPMYLGLDLRGGVHFLMQVDMKSALAKKVESYTNDIRGLLREQRMQHSGIAREGDAVAVRFRDAAMRDKALTRIAKDMPDLELRTADDAGEFRIIGTLKVEAQRRTQEFALLQNINTLRNRVNELGVA
ncbi:MAG: protein-export rane protein, SecD/SecF family, partial [Proteobacteria bacterium]|nr:protein-export rane protein, SecD/SecF family [Pseudomonadota bacterium]